MTGRFFGGALTALFVLVNAVFGASASAQPPLVAQPSMLLLDIDSITPRIVNASANTLSVSAELRNVGDRAITGIAARVQLGAPIASGDELGQALAGDLPIDAQLTPFREVTPRLLPGESTTLSITVGLRGGAESLTLNQPGVYPLLINVNGTPDFGAEARLAALNLLLPVLELPGAEGADSEVSRDGDGVDSGPPVRTSLLWPISYASPRVISAPLGGTLELPDERLADAMRPGGRLDALVGAAESARSDTELFDSMCFAVDPALVATADAMSAGYQVRGASGRVKGAGAGDARRWLDGLRELVDGRCVLAMPYAGADIAALAIDHPRLARAAASGDDLLAESLHVKPKTDAFFAPGTLTDPALDALTEAGRKVLVSDPALLGVDASERGAVTLHTADGDTTAARALPFDGPFARALGIKVANPEVGGNTSMAAAEPTTSGQNGVAAVAFRARFDPAPGDGALLLAPPALFDADTDELVRTLNALSAFEDADMIAPTPLSELLSGAPVGSARANAVDGAVIPRLSGYVDERITAIERTLGDLRQAMSVDATRQVAPDELLRPIREGALRAGSAYWRGQPGLARQSVDDADDELDALLTGVHVSDPGRTISMASGSSPIPVLIQNDLPVVVAVHLTLSNTVGLRPDTVGDLRVPANNSRNIYVPTTALRAGRFSVDVALSTPGGTDLGTPTRFELASTEFGAITVIVTATAAGALLLLSGRRIYRRVRNGRASRGELEM